MKKYNGHAVLELDPCPGNEGVNTNKFRLHCDAFLRSRGLTTGGHREIVARHFRSQRGRKKRAQFLAEEEQE